MKNKDFGFFQQHAEKIALGLGVAVLLGVAATQFVLGNPNEIQLDNQPVAPGEIGDLLTQRADRLQGRLNQDSPIQSMELPSYAESFSKLYELDTTPREPLAVFDQGPLARTWVNIVSPDYPEKILPTPPAVGAPFVRAGHGVLAQEFSEPVSAIRQMIGSPDPADFQYVSVLGEFPMEDWISRLRAPDVPADNRIDEGLWADRLAVAGVTLVREEQDPDTGEWGDRTVVEPLPGQLAFTSGPGPQMPGQLSMEQAQEVEQLILSNQVSFTRPDFPPIQNGPWLPPTGQNRVFTAEEAQRIRDLEDDIERLERNIDRLTGEDSAAERRPAERARGADMGVPEEFDMDPRSSGPSQRRTGRTSADRGDRGADREARQLEAQLQELDELRSELNDLLGIELDPTVDRRMNDFGADPSMPDFEDGRGMRGPEMMGPRMGRDSFGSGRSTTIVPDTVTVWAHDLTVEPGKTYRYKISVAVLNPLFRNPRLTPEQRRENQNRIAVGPSEADLEDVDWSAAVTTDPEHYFFALSGSRDTKRATFEVWTVFDGLWRRSEFVEYPGNEIGDTATPEGTGRPVPMAVGSIMLDVDAVPAPTGRGSAVRVLYLSGEDGKIKTRLVQRDEDSEDRVRLEAEQQQQQRRQNPDSRFGDARNF
jgi:hypothetical protein